MVEVGRRGFCFRAGRWQPASPSTSVCNYSVLTPPLCLLLKCTLWDCRETSTLKSSNVTNHWFSEAFCWTHYRELVLIVEVSGASDWSGSSDGRFVFNKEMIMKETWSQDELKDRFAPSSYSLTVSTSQITYLQQRVSSNLYILLVFYSTHVLLSMPYLFWGSQGGAGANPSWRWGREAGYIVFFIYLSGPIYDALTCFKHIWICGPQTYSITVVVLGSERLQQHTPSVQRVRDSGREDDTFLHQ